VPALENSLHVQDSQLIIESLIALQKIRDPAAGPKVASATHDLDDRVQSTALETVGVLRCLTCEQDVKTALSTARNARIRKAALQTLAMLAIPGDRNTFQQYAHDSDADLRASALEGLGRVRDPEDFPTIEEAYNEKDADWKVHLAAAFAMVDQGKVDTQEFSPLPFLWENLGNGARGSVAQTYLDELARRDDVRQALFTMAADSDKDQKVALCAILADSRAEDAIPTLSKLSKDIDSDVSLAASRALRIVQAPRS
jgi:HEAT repeat protein